MSFEDKNNEKFPEHSFNRFQGLIQNFFTLIEFHPEAFDILGDRVELLNRKVSMSMDDNHKKRVVNSDKQYCIYLQRKENGRVSLYVVSKIERELKQELPPYLITTLDVVPVDQGYSVQGFQNGDAISQQASLQEVKDALNMTIEIFLQKLEKIQKEARLLGKFGTFQELCSRIFGVICNYLQLHEGRGFHYLTTQLKNSEIEMREDGGVEITGIKTIKRFDRSANRFRLITKTSPFRGDQFDINQMANDRLKLSAEQNDKYSLELGEEETTLEVVIDGEDVSWRSTVRVNHPEDGVLESTQYALESDLLDTAELLIRTVYSS